MQNAQSTEPLQIIASCDDLNISIQKGNHFQISDYNTAKTHRTILTDNQFSVIVSIFVKLSSLFISTGKDLINSDNSLIGSPSTYKHFH